MNTPNVTALRDKVFASEYLTKVVGLSPDCTDAEFIRTVANLEQELHLKDDLMKITTEWVCKQEVIEIDKYLICYIQGDNNYLITNLETKKQAIMHIEKEFNKNIDFIKTQMSFMIDNNLKCAKITALDCLN